MVSNVEIWERLRKLTTVGWTAESQTGTGWSGSGSGTVRVSQPTPDVLILEESGTWQPNGGKQLRFINVFRWTLLQDRLRLEHLRLGPNHPVYLFDMAPDTDGIWREVEGHICNKDCYHATLQLGVELLQVGWRVHGPNRDDTIIYIYV